MNKEPYISKIFVKDCFAYQNFEILISEPNENFKHLIITGKNGSGKTTILDNIASVIRTYISNPANKLFNLVNEKNIILEFSGNNKFDKKFIFSYLKDERNIKFSNVETPIKDEIITKTLNYNKEFTKLFKQYLVNKKVFQAFDYLENKNENKKTHKLFFNNFTDILKKMFKDDGLQLIFKQKSFEFYLELSNGQKFTFNQFSAGFFAYLNIILDLLIRTDIIRSQEENYNFNPTGIVLIDEPDVHLHIEMQYQILPMLTKLFPNIQFIVATHSPAIISSIENAVVFDISTQEKVENKLAGSSFSEKMITHLGLENEFSHIAEDIFKQIDDAYNEKSSSKLKQILFDNEKYITPSLRLEIESRIALLKSKQI